MQAALAGGLRRGEGPGEFKKTIDSEFDKAGLSRLKPSQIENIYVTNTSLAYGAGQMGKMLEVSGDFPYWKYSATMDSITRPGHAALHGKIFKVGDFTFFPPIGFRCRCAAIPLTARQAAQYLKSDMPSESEKDSLYNTLDSNEFAGNKQQKYLDWAAEQYKTSDAGTRSLMDGAFDVMRREIRTLEYKSVKEFFTADQVKRIEKDFISNKRVQKAAKAAGLTNADAFRIFAYTDFENGLSSELSRIHYSDLKPTQWTRSQLERYKKDLSKTLGKMPACPGVVYRNLDNVSEDTLKQFTQKDAVIEWDSFSSTTTDPTKYNDRQVRFIINQQSARNIESISKHSDEKEALLPTGARLKVTKVEQGDTQTIVWMTEI